MPHQGFAGRHPTQAPPLHLPERDEILKTFDQQKFFDVGSVGNGHRTTVTIFITNLPSHLTATPFVS